MTADKIRERLLAAFPNATINIKDLTGGGDHWHVAISSEQFQEKSLIQQHQLVYGALGTWMQKDIHALSLDTSVKLKSS